MSNIITLEQTSNLDLQLEEISEYLRKGEIVIAPTETRYGMLVDATNFDELIVKFSKLDANSDREEVIPTSVVFNDNTTFTVTMPFDDDLYVVVIQ